MQLLMNETNEISELIADVREQVVYFKELGVELLDVKMAEVDSAEVVDVNKPATATRVEAHATPVDEILRDLPDLPINVPRVNVPKSNLKKQSKLSGLPSLANRAPVRNGNSVPKDDETHDINSSHQIGKTTKELNALAEGTLKDALFDVGPALPQTGETVEDIRKDIGDCTRCELYAGRKQVVHSTGNLNAELMFVGEAPGADEDEQGFPFVGRAGQLLTKIIEGIGFKREDVFIGNINRCRPPGNRAPTLPEAHTCRPFLLREIAVVKPKVIVVMGNTALHNLLDTKDGITKVRGAFQDYFGVKVMPTFHPAYLLRDPNKKREVWEDMKKVRDYLKTAK
jgi:uracil-DNA glycosylase family 4